MKRLTLILGLGALAAVLAACSGSSAGTAAPAGSVDPNAIVVTRKKANDSQTGPEDRNAKYPVAGATSVA